MRIANRHYRVDWGHLGVVTAIAVICAAYLYDTLTTSLNVNNILFVLPASIVALGLCLSIMIKAFERVETSENAPALPERTQPEEQAAKGERGGDLARIFALMAGFGLYVYLLERIGFDIASWLFILLGLAVCGERRPLALMLYPPIAAALIVLGFQTLIPYPLYTLIL